MGTASRASVRSTTRTVPRSSYCDFQRFVNAPGCPGRRSGGWKGEARFHATTASRQMPSPGSKTTSPTGSDQRSQQLPSEAQHDARALCCVHSRRASNPPRRLRSECSHLPAGHHCVERGAVLGAVNVLRWRFDRATRAACRALTAPPRSEEIRQLRDGRAIGARRLIRLPSLFRLSACYSARNATIGSTFPARRPGSSSQRNPTVASVETATANQIGPHARSHTPQPRAG